MRPLLILSFILLAKSSFAQSDKVAVFNAHKFPCEDNTTTLETNICSGIQFDYADSLLNLVYRRAIKSLDKEIAATEKSIKTEQAKKETDQNKEDIEFAKKQLDNSKRLKENLIRSQQAWIKLRDLNAEIVRTQHEGGTANVAYTNESMIYDTLDRIKKLQEFQLDD
jgi:uncharacterized protein YecT (DUF1311 family)